MKFWFIWIGEKVENLFLFWLIFLSEFLFKGIIVIKLLLSLIWLFLKYGNSKIGCDDLLWLFDSFSFELKENLFVLLNPITENLIPVFFIFFIFELFYFILFSVFNSFLGEFVGISSK